MRRPDGTWNTPCAGRRADSLSQELTFVLDRRLPARLNELSARPEGSQYFPGQARHGPCGDNRQPGWHHDIVLQRVDRGKNGAVWLFSKETLDAIPSSMKK